MPLSGDQVLQAYPLVREAANQPSLDAWQAYVSALAETRGATTSGGVLGALSPDGYVLALCTYRVGLDLEDGRILTVDNLIPSGMPGHQLLTAILFQAIENLAKTYECEAIRVSCPVTRGWLFGVARRRDYWRCRWHFCKRVPA